MDQVQRTTGIRARSTVAVLSALALCAAILLAAPSRATASTDPIGHVTEYDIGSAAGPMIVASDGSIWTGGFLQQLVQVTPDGQVVLRDTVGAPIDPLEHPTGTIWFGLFGGSSIGRFQDGAIQQFPVAGDITGDLILGPDGKVWFSDNAGAVGNVDQDGTVWENQTHGGTRDLLLGPNGNIWFADDEGYIGQVDMANNVTEYPVVGYTTGTGRLGGMVVAPDGNIWFGVFPDAKIGYVSMEGVVSYLDTPTLTRHPIVGPDGDIWFGAEGSIGRVDLDSHEVQTWPTTYDTDFLTIGSDGNIWFGEYGNKIGRITPAGVVTEVDTTGPPQFLVLGADGNIWFGEQAASFIGRVDPADAVTELDTSNQTQYLLNGPGGTVWFATQAASPTPATLGKVTAARSSLTLTYLCDEPAGCTVAPGGTVTVRGTVANHGPSDAGAPTFQLSLPEGLEAVSIQGPDGWRCHAAGSIDCSSGQLVDGAAGTFTATLRVSASAQPGAALVTHADLRSAAPNPDPDSARAEVTIHVAGPTTTTTVPAGPVVPRFTG